MGIVARDSGGEYEPIPVGMFRALCINVFDIGFQKGYQGGPPAHKIVVLWEIEPVSDVSHKHFTITKIYTLSIAEKSTLGIDLVSWRGLAFTPEERKGFDLDKIKGKACQLNIVPQGEKVKVASVLPAQREKGEDGKMVISAHWKPETSADFIPNFVKRMIEEQLPPPERTTEVPDHDGEFTDDIPF